MARKMNPIGVRRVSRKNSRTALLESMRRQGAQPLVLHARVIGNCGGGPDKTVLRSARYLQKLGYRMVALYIHPEGNDGIRVVEQHADALDCPVYSIAERGALDPRTPWRIIQICRQLGVNIFHGHDYKTNLIGLLARKFHPMACTTTVHGWVTNQGRARLYYQLDRWAQHAFDHVIAVSPDLEAQCRKLGVAKDRLTYIPNAIEPDAFEREMTQTQARQQLGMSPDARILGCVSRLQEEKGLDRLLNALPAILQRHPQAELHIVGEGPCMTDLQTQAKQLNLTNAVKFHGWQSDVRLYMQAFDMVVMPSRAEGLPNTLLEAMALEVPTAATQVGGNADLLDRGRCGLLLNDYEARWSDEISAALSDQAQLNQWAQRGREQIETHFSFETRMRKVAKIYDSLLGRQSHTEQQEIPVFRSAA